MKKYLTLLITLCLLTLTGCGSGTGNNVNNSEDSQPIQIEIDGEVKEFSSSDNVIEIYNENVVRNEKLYINANITCSGEIVDISISTKNLNIGNQNGNVEFANIELDNGCIFIYNINNDDGRAFVEELNVGQQVTLNGTIGEISSTIKATGHFN